MLVSIFLCWNLWKLRCSILFDGSTSWTGAQLISSIFRDLHSSVYLRPLVRSHADDDLLLRAGLLPNFRPTTRWIPTPIFWSMPRGSSLKLNIDGSSLGNPGSSGAGVVLRNQWGEVLSACAHFLGNHTNIFAETQALLLGLRLCVRMGCGSVLVETDSTVVLHYTQCQDLWPWRLFSELTEIALLLTSYDFHLQHVFWEGNTVADALAKLASSVANKYVLKN